MPLTADPAGSKVLTSADLDDIEAKLKAPPGPQTPPAEPSIWEKFLDKAGKIKNAWQSETPEQRGGAVAGGVVAPVVGEAIGGPVGALGGAAVTGVGAGLGNLLGQFIQRHTISNYLKGKAQEIGVPAKSLGVNDDKPYVSSDQPYDFESPVADAVGTFGLSTLAKGAGAVAAKMGAPRVGGVLAAETPQAMAYRAAPAAVKGMSTPALTALDEVGASAAPGATPGATGLPGMQAKAGINASVLRQRARDLAVAEGAERAASGLEPELQDAVLTRAQQVSARKPLIDEKLGPSTTDTTTLTRSRGASDKTVDSFRRVERKAPSLEDDMPSVTETKTEGTDKPTARSTVETNVQTSSLPTAEQKARALESPESVWGTADDPAIISQKFIQDQMARRAAPASLASDALAKQQAAARLAGLQSDSKALIPDLAGNEALSPATPEGHGRFDLPGVHWYDRVPGIGMTPDKAGQAVASTLAAREGESANPYLRALLSRSAIYKASPVPQGLNELLRQLLAARQTPQSSQGGSK